MARIVLIILGLLVVLAAGFAAYLLWSLQGYADYWNHLAAETAPANAITYVVLGDSTGQGIGALPVTQSYPSQVAKHLTQATGRPVHIMNLSKSGVKVADVLNRQLPALAALKQQPDLVTIEIGANDMPDFDADRFRTEMNKVMQQLPPNTALSDIPFFGGLTQLPFFGAGKSERTATTANEIMRELASANHIALVPLHAAMTQHNRYPWQYAIDYFHPNNLGYKTWTNVFWQAIQDRGLVPATNTTKR